MGTMLVLYVNIFQPHTAISFEGDVSSFPFEFSSHKFFRNLYMHIYIYISLSMKSLSFFCQNRTVVLFFLLKVKWICMVVYYLLTILLRYDK